MVKIAGILAIRYKDCVTGVVKELIAVRKITILNQTIA